MKLLGIPIHTCNMIPKYPGFHLIPKQDTCPWCGELMNISKEALESLDKAFNANNEFYLKFKSGKYYSEYPVNKMTPEQESHLQSIKSNFNTLVDAKYRKGQAEHGGDLFELDNIKLVDAAIDEAIDQVVYLLTLRDKLNGTIRNPDVLYLGIQSKCMKCSYEYRSIEDYTKHAIAMHCAVFDSAKGTLKFNDTLQILPPDFMRVLRTATLDDDIPF